MPVKDQPAQPTSRRAPIGILADLEADQTEIAAAEQWLASLDEKRLRMYQLAFMPLIAARECCDGTSRPCSNTAHEPDLAPEHEHPLEHRDEQTEPIAATEPDACKPRRRARAVRPDEPTLAPEQPLARCLLPHGCERRPACRPACQLRTGPERGRVTIVQGSGALLERIERGEA